MLPGDVPDLVGRPVEGGEMLLQSAQVQEDVDELAVECWKAVETRETFHVSAQCRLDGLPGTADASDREVPRPPHPVWSRGRRLGGPAERLVQEGLGRQDRGQLEHGRSNPASGIRLWVSDVDEI